MFKITDQNIKKQDILISVLIPVYNRQDYIAECIQNLIDQSYKNIEILIYNDGSTDDTLNQIPEDDRIRIINSSENKGISFGRNILLKESRGIYSMWQDSDDLCSNDRIMSNLDYILKKNQKNQFPEMVLSNIIFFRSNQNPRRKRAPIYKPNLVDYPYSNGLCAKNMTFATGFFVTELCKNVLFDLERKNGGGDLDWLKRLNISFDYMDKALYYCRRHTDRITFKRKFERIKRQGLDPYKDKWIQSHILK